jgi:hypothetical protein
MVNITANVAYPYLGFFHEELRSIFYFEINPFFSFVNQAMVKIKI